MAQIPHPTFLNPPTKKQLADIRASVGLTEEQISQAVKELSKWLEDQPHLPNGHDEDRLKLLFLHCKGSLKKVHQSLDTYYSMKNTVPEILDGRDPFLPWFKTASEISYIFPMPTLTDDNCRITLCGLLDPNLSIYNVNESLKVGYMSFDARYLEEFCPRDIYIMDLGRCKAGHIAKYPFRLTKLIHDFGLVGYRVQLSSAHFVNAPIYFDIFMTIVKLILKPKLFNRIHVHRNGLGNLFDYVPQKLLPAEYGGEAGSIRELWEAWKKVIVSRRDWYLEQDKLRTDESKRPKK